MSPSESSSARPRLIEWVVVSALILVGAARIASTWSVFNQTFDEGWHVGVGMEWLDKGQYTYELKHPPVARIAVALGPWLSGLHSTGDRNLWGEGRAILYQNGTYTKNLSLARAGVLPFFALGVVFLWLLTRRLFGPIAGVAAAGLFSTLPPILGHSGVATTDIPMTGAFAALLYASTVWLERPTVQRGLWLGAAGALTLLTKFSSIPYFGVAAILALLARWRGARLGDTSAEAATRRDVVWSALAAGLTAFVIAWATYRFSINPIRGIPVPLREIVEGIRMVAQHNAQGQVSYVLGRADFEGMWYFFPVVLLFKTPLPVLLLSAAGLWYAWRLSRERGEWRSHVPLIVVVAVLAVALPSRVNLGVRHVLPIYLGLSAAAGLAVARLWEGSTGLSKRAARGVLAGLMATYLVGTAIAHPDYLAYFNVLARGEPGRVLVDSDLDWGQDLARLGDEVRRRQIDTITVVYFGSADLAKHVPHSAPADLNVRPKGWFAISETNYRRGRAVLRQRKWTLYPDHWAWLRPIEPVALVGKSIRLYQLD